MPMFPDLRAFDLQHQLHVTNKCPTIGNAEMTTKTRGRSQIRKARCVASPSEVKEKLKLGYKRLTIMTAQNKEYWSKTVNKYETITGIETGSEGIFATCDRNTEPKCVGEMYRLLEEVRAE